MRSTGGVRGGNGWGVRPAWNFWGSASLQERGEVSDAGVTACP